MVNNGKFSHKLRHLFPNVMNPKREHERKSFKAIGEAATDAEHVVLQASRQAKGGAAAGNATVPEWRGPNLQSKVNSFYLFLNFTEFLSIPKFGPI